MDFFDPKIPKKKVMVEILHTHSSQYLLKCVLFLNTNSKYSEVKPETMQEFLHNCGQFIPTRQATSDNYNDTANANLISLYNVNSIIYIKELNTCTPDELKDLSNIQITLNNKSSLKLSISKSTMGNRLAEYVNSPSLFLKFIKGKSYIHLNKNYIFSIRNT